MASISSMKTMDGACSSATLKSSRTSLGPSPRYFWISSEPTTRRKVADVWLATALASRVLPGAKCRTVYSQTLFASVHPDQWHQQPDEILKISMSCHESNWRHFQSNAAKHTSLNRTENNFKIVRIFSWHFVSYLWEHLVFRLSSIPHLMQFPLHKISYLYIKGLLEPTYHRCHLEQLRRVTCTT